MGEEGASYYSDTKEDQPATDKEGISRRSQNATGDQEMASQHHPDLANANVADNIPACANRADEAMTITGHGNTMIRQQTVHVSRTESSIPRSLQEFFKKYLLECRRFARSEFVEIRGGTKALKMVKVKRIVSIIGSPGGGKSSIAKWLVTELFTDEYEIIVVKSIKDWRKYVDSARKQIIVIEDIFGSSQFDSDVSKAWLGLALEMQLDLENSLIYVVITSRTSIYNESGLLSSHGAFLHIVDLNDKDSKLTPREKKDMLLHHMALNKRKTASMKDKDIPFATDAIIGFPECCRIFCKYNVLQQMGVEFFTKPSSHLKEVLMSMSRKMRDKFTALVYCMLRGGAIPTRCCEATGKCPKLEISLKSCGLKGDESVRIVAENMDILLNSFLLPGETGIAYKIQHHTLIEALVDVFCNDCRGHNIIIKHADLKFIANNVQIEDWKVSHQNTILIDNQDFEQLWTRIMIELSIESRHNIVMESLLFKHDGFDAYFINQLIKQDKLVTFLEQNDYFLLKYNLHEHSDQIGWHNMTLIKIITQSDVVDHILKSAKCNRRMLISYILLWSSALDNNNEVNLKLLSDDSNSNIKGDCDITPIHCAVQEGSIVIVRELLKRSATQTATESRKNTPLHIAALLGRNDKIPLLIEYDARLDDINSNHNTALHFASQNGHTDTVELLLKNNASILVVNENSSTPLHLACYNGHTGVTRLLLDHGANLSIVDKWGYTPLHTACREGHTDTVSLLLEHHSNMSAVDQWGYTPLHRACREGHIDVVRLLLENHASPSAVDQWGYTPLQRACREGRTDTVRLLLQHHASISAVDQWGYTPLHRACKEGHTDTVSLLLKHHASLSAVDKWGYIPLHEACQEGHTDVARLLLEHHASLSAVNQWGITSLHRACRKGHIYVVRLLLEHHASLSAVDQWGYTPLQRACREGHTDTVRLLLEHHASLSAADQWGYTPLHRACKEGHTDTVSLLLEHHANMSAVDQWGHTPLHRACHEGHLGTVSVLVEHHASLSAPDQCGHIPLLDHIASLSVADQWGYSPLHRACQEGHTDTVRLLLKHNASLAAVDRWGYTSLHIACQEGHTDTSTLLLEHHASISAANQQALTPLHWACHNGHTDTTRLLLEYHACLSAVDQWGNTPLHRACHNGHTDTTRLLLEHHANISELDMWRFTPLHRACYKGHTDTIKLLLDYHASLSAADHSGITPIHLACHNNRLDTVKLMLEHHASLSAVIKTGYTPLHMAAYNGHNDMAKLLLNNGAGQTAVIKRGLTPLQLAYEQNHPATAQLLREHLITLAQDKIYTKSTVLRVKNCIFLLNEVNTSCCQP